uniref:Uncharacterized protein n=1 Tax=Oryza nivara TaxID=4536 RepID=A0A0E0IUZ9_ORYNI
MVKRRKEDVAQRVPTVAAAAVPGDMMAKVLTKAREAVLSLTSENRVSGGKGKGKREGGEEEEGEGRADGERVKPAAVDSNSGGLDRCVGA